jgi:pyruvate formate lyase activating enzyme
MTTGGRGWGERLLNRRSFVRQSACTLALFSLPTPLFPFFPQNLRQGLVKPHPALFYQVRPNQKVKCQLCPRQCEVKPGERGDCGVRENRKGSYYSLVYGNPCAVHVDPIEKKPLFHVLPGTPSYSIATAGCNLHCIFCQNWEISQAKPEETYNFDKSPDQVVAEARQNNCPSIAYTYVEPVIFYEYMLDTARVAKKDGILNVCHSAGYVSPEPLAKLAEVLDAACIDLKAFDNKFYQEMVDGELEPVLATLKTLSSRGVHVEIVNLVIPQKNDQPAQIKALCQWIKKELGPLTPLHFSRFFPLHKMKNHYPTPVSTLEEARRIALDAGLKYVYLGNLPGNPAENTNCHNCGKLVIGRRGYMVGEINIKDDKCRHCGTRIPGIWKS